MKKRKIKIVAYCPCFSDNIFANQWYIVYKINGYKHKTEQLGFTEPEKCKAAFVQAVKTLELEDFIPTDEEEMSKWPKRWR